MHDLFVIACRYRDFKKAMQFVRECRSQDLDTQKLASMGRQGADCLFQVPVYYCIILLHMGILSMYTNPTAMWQLLKRGVTPLRFWKSVLVDAVSLCTPLFLAMNSF